MQIQANGLSLEVDIQGPADGAPLVLLMGLGMQLIGWPEPFVEMLTQRGHKVIRLDNRDAGLSQGFDDRGTPNVAWAALRYAFRLRVRSVYSIADMAADTIGVLNALGIDRAHIVGASMGGMIAQHIAARHPQRVAALTLMMTTSGARGLPESEREGEGGDARPAWSRWEEHRGRCRSARARVHRHRQPGVPAGG